MRELVASSLRDPRSPHGKRLTAFLVRRSLSHTDFGISKWDFYYSAAPCLLPVRSLQWYQSQVDGLKIGPSLAIVVLNI